MRHKSAVAVPDDPSADAGRWAAVDACFAQLLAPDDDALQAALADNRASGLPPHDVSAVQGKMLTVLARMAGARRILEIGTLGGYSTIRLARGLASGGRVVTLERDEARARVARRNIARAGLSDVVEVRIGDALDLLPGLEGPFDPPPRSRFARQAR
jgi:predicted O-methyltransferase YrrM